MRGVVRGDVAVKFADFSAREIWMLISHVVISYRGSRVKIREMSLHVPIAVTSGNETFFVKLILICRCHDEPPRAPINLRFLESSTSLNSRQHPLHSRQCQQINFVIIMSAAACTF